MTYTGSGEPAVPAPSAAPGSRPGAGPVPDPPQGPGVTPPFPVPPTEGRRSRVWLGIGIGALVTVLVCGGGVAAVIGLATTGARALNEQVDVVVGDYFEAVKQKRFDQAYEQLCEDAQDDESPAEFTRRLSAEPAVADYTVGNLAVSAIEPIVPVDVVYVGGARDTVRVSLSQNSSTGRLEVCGVEG